MRARAHRPAAPDRALDPSCAPKLDAAYQARATIVCEDGLIRAQDLCLAAPPRVSAIVDSTELNVVERQAIERVMRNVSGNKARAARQLGISRTQLYIRLRKHGLEGAGA